MAGKSPESKPKLSSGLMGMKFMQKSTPSENTSANTASDSAFTPAKPANKQPQEKDTSSWSFAKTVVKQNTRQPTVGYSDLFVGEGRRDYSK